MERRFLDGDATPYFFQKFGLRDEAMAIRCEVAEQAARERGERHDASVFGEVCRLEVGHEVAGNRDHE